MNSLFFLPKCFNHLKQFFGFEFQLYIFNSKSSSSTENISTDTRIDKDTGFQDSGGVLAIGEQGGFGSKVNVEILDDGAINSAFDFANESQAFWGENFQSVLGLVEKTNETAGDRSVESQRVIAKAFTDSDAIEATGGVSSIMPLLSGAVVIGGLYFLVTALKG